MQLWSRSEPSRHTGTFHGSLVLCNCGLDLSHPDTREQAMGAWSMQLWCRSEPSRHTGTCHGSLVWQLWSRSELSGHTGTSHASLIWQLRSTSEPSGHTGTSHGSLVCATVVYSRTIWTHCDMPWEPGLCNCGLDLNYPDTQEQAMGAWSVQLWSRSELSGHTGTSHGSLVCATVV